MPSETIEAKMEEYVNNGGENCPFCNSENIVEGGTEESRMHIYRNMCCSDCLGEWTDLLELTEAEPFEAPVILDEYVVYYVHKGGTDSFIMKSDHPPTEEEVVTHIPTWDPEKEWIDVRPISEMETVEVP